MPRTVFKYRIDSALDDPVFMPRDAVEVLVGHQGRHVFVWAEHWLPEEEGEEKRMEKRRYGVYGTGHEIPDEATHVGSFLTQPDGAFVWHVYRLPL